MKCSIQLLALVLISAAAGSAVDAAIVRRTPSAPTLAECLGKEVPGYRDHAKVPIQALKKCMGQVQKREEIGAEEADVDVSSYIIDGGKPNVKIA